MRLWHPRGSAWHSSPAQSTSVKAIWCKRDIPIWDDPCVRTSLRNSPNQAVAQSIHRVDHNCVQCCMLSLCTPEYKLSKTCTDSVSKHRAGLLWSPNEGRRCVT
eukprot:1707113-Amphidinium_carterae.1